MIKTASDLESAIEYLKKESIEYPTVLTEKMDSNAFNQSFKNIENQLNTLYEKIRITEDLKQYCKNYVLEQIGLKQQQFKEKLKVIEDLADQYLEKEYVVYTIPIEYNSEIVKDRDGNVISNINFINNELQQTNTTIQTCRMASINFFSNQDCYSNNANNLLNNMNSCSYYIVDEPFYDGIDETYTILFNTTYDLNYIDLSLANSQIKRCLLILTDNSEQEIEVNTTFSTIKAKGIKIIIHSDNYTFINIKELNTGYIDEYVFFNSNNKISNSNLLKEDIVNAEKVYSENELKKFIIEHNSYIKEVEKINQKNILSNNDKNIVYEYSNDSGVLDNSLILQKNKNGSILQSYGERGLKYIPQENLQKKINIVNGAYNISSEQDIYKRPYISDIIDESKINSNNILTYTKVKYCFGINNITTKYIKNNTVCGYISKAIEIGHCSYIKLSVKANKDISNLEFYIIEEGKEFPMLPIETDKVTNEKIFFNMDTRFVVDKTKDIIIKKNQEITSLSLADLNNLNLETDIYTIDYIPAIQQQLYYPDNISIKIKIIQRCLFEDSLPINISSINILKYGGDKVWNI